MRFRINFLIACLAAALAPAIAGRLPPDGRADANAPAVAFPGWAASFEGRPLIPLKLSEREEQFGADFPGRVARFTDGEREIIMRWVTTATRKLHPAADCFRATGYDVRPLPLHVDSDGARWASFSVARDDERLIVRERIYDAAGASWTDASSWYWAATGGGTAAPWWAITVAERASEKR